jgi:hypothetical protein
MEIYWQEVGETFSPVKFMGAIGFFLNIKIIN